MAQATTTIEKADSEVEISLNNSNNFSQTDINISDPKALFYEDIVVCRDNQASSTDQNPDQIVVTSINDECSYTNEKENQTILNNDSEYGKEMLEALLERLGLNH